MKTLILVISMIWLAGCDSATEEKDTFDCYAITDLELCDWTRCDIRWARSYTEGTDHAVCDTAHSVCVPKLVGASENDPQGCPLGAIANYCLDTSGEKFVIEDVFAPYSLESPSDQIVTPAYFKLPGWELCSCVIPIVYDKKVEPSNDYVSICYYCGDGWHNDFHNTPETCDGNWFNFPIDNSNYWELFTDAKAPCDQVMDATGYITCNSDCTQNRSQCIPY